MLSMSSRFFSHNEYPPYYQPVTIQYFDKETFGLYYDTAWVAVNDNGEYVWTSTKLNYVYLDSEILDWEY